MNSSNPVCPVEMESTKSANCEDIDLLSISCKLANLSTNAVSKCLGLQESHVRDALKEATECYQNYNKVHLLLIKWQEVNGDGATKSALLQCLQNLPDKIKDEPQMNPSSKYVTEIGLQFCKPVGVGVRGLLIAFLHLVTQVFVFWGLLYISKHNSVYFGCSVR